MVGDSASQQYPWPAAYSSYLEVLDTHISRHARGETEGRSLDNNTHKATKADTPAGGHACRRAYMHTCTYYISRWKVTKALTRKHACGHTRKWTHSRQTRTEAEADTHGSGNTY